MRTTTIQMCQSMKESGEKITVLTAYDASFAQLISEAGIDAILIGDSLGSVIQGQSTTVPVTMDEMVYHTRCVARGNRGALLIGDMPFMAYATVDMTLHNATRLMQAGAAMVKMEGGAWLVPAIEALQQRGVPVCGHLGLTPQSIHKLGGHKVQGRDKAQADKLYQDASALQAAGVSLLFLECVPAPLAADISQALTIPTIGIGAGCATDGQVLVCYDMLGLTPGKALKLSKNFLIGSQGSVDMAVKSYIAEVKAQRFPTAENSFI
jgi:3-methyl-2-oxobutanoate hydroxymethyltransferase